ncbi:hypothetical protein GOODEAATRI_025403, partial [Goodea atripinnis]
VNFLTIPSDSVTLEVLKEADKFSISPTGEVKTKVKLDHDDAPHNYSVEISISDGATSDTAVVEVQVTDINDNSPVFASSSVTKSVPEDAKVGSNITDVAATDKDSGFNKEIRYSLRGGEGRFFIDPVFGMVSLAAGLDRETTAEYELLVMAEDQGRPARSATATLLLQVTDINDNIPMFSKAEYQLEVLETESVGTSLLTLSAEDPDEAANGRVTYSISQQSPSSEPAVFELEASSGILKLAQPLNYSDVKVFILNVQASDGGTPSLVGNGSVVVKVKDFNNNPPKFSKESYDVVVFENLASGASIITLEVTDIDEVVAVDQATDGLNATAQLNITVLDYNDNTPQFPSIPYPLQFPEGEYSKEKPGEIFTILPTDADIDLNGEVTLMGCCWLLVPWIGRARKSHVVVNIRVASLVEGVAFQSFFYNFSLPENNLTGATVGQVRASSGSNVYEVSYSLKTHTDLFSINSDGAIMTTKELDKEQQEWYILDVEAVDTRTPPTSALALALDPDVGDSSGLVYSLSDSSSFDVEPASGLVYVVSAADLGGKTVPLEVIVEDSASSSDVTIISLNQLANVVESKVPELEESLGKVLGWAVNIIQVWSSVGEETRMLRASVRTMVSFVAHDKGEAISAEEVRKKLQSASNDVKAELVLLFGDGVNFNVETGSPSSTSDQVAVIVLGILLAVTVLGLIVAVVFVV